MHPNRWLHLAVLMSAFDTVRGNVAYIQTTCRYLDPGDNAEFIFSVFYNMFEYIRYNSSENKIVGFGDAGEKWAEEFSNNSIILAQADFGIHECNQNENLVYPFTKIAVKPDVIIWLETETGVNQEAVLVCSAYDFYPQLIKLTWMRDDEVLSSDVTSTEEMPDGDWFYQIHSHLEYTPKPGEKIFCVVEHASLNPPMVIQWKPSLTKAEMSKIILGIVGMLLGLFMAAGSHMYYKRKNTGFYRLPACLVSMEMGTGNEEQL